MTSEGTFDLDDNQESCDLFYPFIEKCLLYVRENCLEEWNKGDKEDGLMWLGLQFGYTEEQLNDILYEESEDEISDSFLEKIGEEAKEGEYLRGEHLYFYGKSTIREMLRQRDENKQVTVTPECSCGLFDSNNGDGSSMGIELKGNVVVPSDMIVEFVPDVDTRHSYSIYSTYGFTPDGHLIVK